MPTIDLIGNEPSGVEVKMPTHAAVQSCEHPLVPKPAFDEDAARGLDVAEIRRRWPRTYSRCPSCGNQVVMYASMAHYIYGDY